MSQAVGFYSDGNLENQSPMPWETEVFLKVFRARQRHWATDQLIREVHRAAESLQYYFPGGERIQMGDISGSRGGPLSLHASHQNGLDVDIAYLRRDHVELDPRGFGRFTEVFVFNNVVTDNFDIERNWLFIQSLVAGKKVSRIFVDQNIKRLFCDWLSIRDPNILRDQITEETLRRLRPWPHHADHMHARFVCPAQSSRCVPQSPPPQGHGCGSSGLSAYGEYGDYGAHGQHVESYDSEEIPP